MRVSSCKHLWPRLRQGALLLVAGLCLAPSIAMPAAIQPHRAVYQLSLAETESDSDVLGADGLMQFEWSDACDAWTVSQRAQIRVGYNDGRVTSFGWIYNAWESKDGKEYRFFIRRLYGGGDGDEIRGEATLEGPRGPGRAYFTLPEEREVELPVGTIFPNQHTLELLTSLENDKMPLWREVFDGSSDDGIFGVSAAVGRSLPGQDQTALDDPLLMGQESWRLLIAFFGMDEAQAEPEQEQELRLFANGISDQLTFDYGDFSVAARMVELTNLSSDNCGASE